MLRTAIALFGICIPPHLVENAAHINMDRRKASLGDRFLDGLGHALKDRRNPTGLWQRIVRQIRQATVAANVVYAAALLLLLAAMVWVGERHWFTAWCLYVPAQAWLLPLPILGLSTLVLCRKWLLLELGCVLLVAFGYYQFFWRDSKPTGASELKVMTNNIGQNNRQSFAPFLNEEDPDIVVLQESPGMFLRFARAYTNYHAKGIHQFTLLSKFPITNAGLLPIRDKLSQPVAAWFDLEYGGGTLVVYNVHLPSPRRELYRLYGLDVLAAIAGIGQSDTRFGRYRKACAEAWSERVKVARQLDEELRKETRPFVVAGDFNMPSRGYLHRLFASHLKDAFAEAGSGYGLTFPGYTTNPLTLFGPWLRIDYVFAGNGFQPVYCVTEPNRKSQHRAIAARFKRSEK